MLYVFNRQSKFQNILFFMSLFLSENFMFQLHHDLISDLNMVTEILNLPHWSYSLFENISKNSTKCFIWQEIVYWVSLRKFIIFVLILSLKIASGIWQKQ